MLFSHELFLLWSLPFWILVAVEILFLFWAVSCRRGFFAFLSLLLFCVLLEFCGNVPVFNWVRENPWNALSGLGVWLAASVPWAFTKWWLFVTNNSHRYDEILHDYRNLAGNEELPANANDFSALQKVEWKEYFDAHSGADEWYEYSHVEFYPKVRDHKSDILVWMMFWPWSLLWTTLNDPLRRLFQHLYWQISDSLQSISDRYWKDKEGHMPTLAEIDAVRAERQRQSEAAAQQVEEAQTSPNGRHIKQAARAGR